jgi:Gamma-glutamyltranspeptidase
LTPLIKAADPRTHRQKETDDATVLRSDSDTDNHWCAVATAGVLSLVEPMMVGIASDLFAVSYIAKDSKVYVLNASGTAPTGATLEHLNLARTRCDIAHAASPNGRYRVARRLWGQTCWPVAASARFSSGAAQRAASIAAVQPSVGRTHPTRFFERKA